MKFLTLLTLMIMCFSSFSQELKTQEEKENEIIDYSNIQNVLKADGLKKIQQKRVETVKKIKEEKKELIKKKYNYPSVNDFWEIISEMWLVKNAQLLRWDFPKPEYGIKAAFEQTLERYGYYNINFKVLIVNTPVVSHLGLPAGKDKYIFILSLPFMRGLDLTKVDISLLLLEDFFRLKKKQFIDNLDFDKSIIGSNFGEKGFSKELFTKVLKLYSKIVLTEGFSFEQQFLITKEMDMLLKGDPSLWNIYFKLYNKIDRFVKTDALFKNYLKVYPSPELQIKWLSPKKKVI